MTEFYLLKRYSLPNYSSAFFFPHLNLPKQGFITVNGILFFFSVIKDLLSKLYLDSNNNNIYLDSNKKWSWKAESYSSVGYH